jgi:hypothetical protein
LTPGAATYTVQSIAWATAAGASLAVGDNFVASTVYKATIALKAAANYKFTGTITPTADAGTPEAGTISGGDVAENTLSFVVTFATTTLNSGPLTVTVTVPDEDAGTIEFVDPVVGGLLTITNGSTYTDIKWFVNSVEQAWNAGKTTYQLNTRVAGTYNVEVQAKDSSGAVQTGRATVEITTL